MISPTTLKTLSLSGFTLAIAACNAPSFETVAPVVPPTMTTTADAGAALPMDPPTDPATPGDADGDGYIDAVDPSGTLSPEWLAALDDRELDYGAALRTASLRLRGVIPTLVEIRYVQGAADPRIAYEQLIDQYLADARFHRRITEFFRDTFRMGGGSLESAPLFAAELVVEDRDFTEIFTAISGTCPTYDAETQVFVPGDCDNGVSEHAGLLTHPGVMKQFASNLAFRRVRWVQEVFACTPFPAETGGSTDVGGPAPYTAPWAFESISGEDNGGRIDFHDTSSVICANCHATMNHIAPLFAHFDMNGMWQDDFAVTLPLVGAPMALRTDWLPTGEATGWRMGVPASDLPALGEALAADPVVARCAVSRVWNWAMGHGDVIGQVDVVPETVVSSLVDDYVSGGHHLRETVRAVFTSSDFVHF